MPYVSATVGSVADLLTTIQNACTANDWTLSAGGVLSHAGCYAELKVASGAITIRGGTGVDGGGNLTGATNKGTGKLAVQVGPAAIVWPIRAEVFVNADPDEVYVVITYATNYFQAIGWGRSAMPGLVGSGNWYCGVNGGTYAGFTTTLGENNTGNGDGVCSLFARRDFSSVNGTHGVDHSLDGPSWADANALADMGGIIARQPNTWDQEAVLIPIRVYASRAGGFISPVLECAHARFVNIANLGDGQTITLGADRWRVYPAWHRGTAFLSNAGSWWLGHAFRYDGP